MTHPRLRAFVDVLSHYVGVLGVEPSGTRAASTNLCDLLDDPDSEVRFLASVLASHLAENEGDATTAMEHLERALALTRNDDGPWMTANLHAQMASLLAQTGRHREAAEHARLTLPVLDRLGSVDTEMALAVLALAELADGNIDAAAERVAQIDRRPRMGQDWPGGSVVGNVRAELLLARGDIDEGLAQFSRTIEMLRAWRAPGPVVLPDFEPWLLYPEAVRLAACVVHGRLEQASPLRDDLLERVVPVLRGDHKLLDYPIAGTMLFALGLWEAAAGHHDVAARLVALGRAFGYSQMLPSVAWSHAEAAVEPRALARACESVGDRRHEQLRGQALDLATEL